LISIRVPFFKQAIQESIKTKYTTFDGLRGFAAISVFFVHALTYYIYFQTGDWTTPPSLHTFLGKSAVAFFFMITGFLFWSKAINGKINIKSFYTRRALRIYPLYWFSLAWITLIVLISSNFSLKVSLIRLFYEITRWLTCGLFNLPFITGIVSSPSINTINTIPINAGIQWTLIYEVQFYLVLPLLAILAKPSRFIFLFAFLVALSQLIAVEPIMVMINFLFGMTAAYILQKFKLEKVLSHWIASILIILLIFIAALAIDNKLMFYFVIFSIFLIIAYGNSIFGLLSLKAARHLGTISYSVYLLHGIIIFSVLKIVNIIYPIQAMSPITYWILIGLCSLILIPICSLTYRFIEHPFLKKPLPLF
jgi:peptidoglycan/LPS O-acetylase OafA/YrhL